MGLDPIPPADVLPFGRYLVAERRITRRQLDLALGLQRRRPFLELGEVLWLMGALDEHQLGGLLTTYRRETRLGGQLIARGLLTIQQLAEALEQQLVREQPLGEVLIALGYVDAATLFEVLRARDPAAS